MCHRLIFAAYVNLVPLHNMDDVAGVGEMLSEIAGAVYQYAPPPVPVAQKKSPNRQSQHN